MELNKKNKVCTSYLDGKEDLRFELFDWLKEKGLTVNEATELLSLTQKEILAASSKQLL